ncbi:hypothetical protein AHF37_07465 [Paragonimus kellicotti]|nr:hypothetical protein AHF37_07465 [Paragonimus kellicotti]
MWNVYGDYITMRLTKADAGCTRRALLSFVASIYDPLGFVAPVLLPAKLLLQSFVRKNMNWDEIADEAEMSEWHSFLVDIRLLEQVRIPRPLIPMTFAAVDMRLHCFSDASELGYGAVIYARVESDDKRVMCSIVMGKSRVSPIKSVTIPRLELTAAVLAARLATQAMEEFKLKSNPIFWVDSIVILRFTTLTANRLSAIHQCSSPAQWRYVETSENPADLASRGIRACDERKLDRWFNGPDFLRREESDWPTVPKALGEIPREWLKKDVISVYHSQMASSWFDAFASCASWMMLRRRIAILLRFKNI